MDRAYRYGQTRDVHVYRLLGAGSIEELIYARQVYKQQMMRIGYEASTQTRYFDAVQGVKKGELFGQDNLFKLHEDTLATKMTVSYTSFAWIINIISSHFALRSKRRTLPSLTGPWLIWMAFRKERKTLYVPKKP